MTPLTRRALALVALAAAAAAFAVTLVQPYDPDMFHHLALGREIARSGLRAEESLLYPFRGVATGPAQYWLGSLAIHGWHALAGTGGLALLPAGVGALLLLVLLADSAPRGARHAPATLAAAALPLALAVAAYRHRAMARPEIFALLFLAVTLWAIRRFEDGRTWPLLMLPPLAALWTNVHPSAIAGVGLVALLAGAGAVQHGAARALRRAPPTGAPPLSRVALAGGVAAAALAASTLSPSGVGPLRSALLFLRAALGAGAGAGAPAAGASALELIRRNVVEMAPPGAEVFTQPAGILLALTALSFALRWRAIRWRELATFAVFALLATRALRFTVLFAVVSAPFAARNLGEAIAGLPRGVRVPWRAAVAALAALSAAAAIPLARDPILRFGTGLRPGAFPVRALDTLERIGFDGRIFNSFELGGYVAWRGFPAYQDGRGIVPPGTEAASLAGPVVRETFAALDERFGFDALVLAPLYEHARSAPLRPGDDWYADGSRWALVAFDDGGVLFLRRDGRWGPIAARDEFRWARPSTAPYQWPRELLGGVLEDYRRSVAEAPTCMVCRFFLASAAVAAGRFEEALEAAAPVLRDDDIQAEGTLPVAAAAAEALGRNDEARAHLERLLVLRPGDPAARQGLARLAALRERGARAAEAQGLHDRGLAAYRAGDLAGAVRLFEGSIRALEPNPAAHANLGFVYLDLRRPDDAIREQRAAIAQAPRFAPAHFGLGMALMARGDRAGAATALRTYLELEPSGPWSATAAQGLAALGQP